MALKDQMTDETLTLSGSRNTPFKDLRGEPTVFGPEKQLFYHGVLHNPKIRRIRSAKTLARCLTSCIHDVILKGGEEINMLENVKITACHFSRTI